VLSREAAPTGPPMNSQKAVGRVELVVSWVVATKEVWHLKDSVGYSGAPGLHLCIGDWRMPRGSNLKQSFCLLFPSFPARLSGRVLHSADFVQLKISTSEWRRVESPSAAVAQFPGNAWVQLLLTVVGVGHCHGEVGSR